MLRRESMQGDFKEALVLHYTDPVPVEDTGMPLESKIRVVVARECNAGDMLRVALPERSIQDLAGNALAEALSAQSTCMEQPLRELPRAAQYLKFLGASLVVLVAGGCCAVGWLLWNDMRAGSSEVVEGGGAARHSKGAAMAVAMATLALFLQGMIVLQWQCCYVFLTMMVCAAHIDSIKPVPQAIAKVETEQSDAGQRIALYMLPMLCQGTGCDASSVASLQWTLLGAVTTAPTQPLSLSPLSGTFPTLADDANATARSMLQQGDLDAPHVNVYLVGAQERDDGSVGACDPSGILCGHRWLGNATRSSFEKDSVQTFLSSNLTSSGMLLEASEPQNSGNVLAADSLVRNFDAVSTGAQAAVWRIVLGVLAMVALLAAASAAGMYAWRAFTQDQQSFRVTASATDSAEGDQVEKGAVSKVGAAVGTPTSQAYACTSSPWGRARSAMQIFAALAPVATISAAIGVSASGAVRGPTDGGIVIAVFTALAFAALLAALAVFYTAQRKRGVGSDPESNQQGTWPGRGTGAHALRDHDGKAAARRNSMSVLQRELKPPSRDRELVEVSASRPHSIQKMATVEDSFVAAAAAAAGAAGGSTGGAAAVAQPGQKAPPGRRSLASVAARAGRALTMRRGQRGAAGYTGGSASAIAAAYRAHTLDLERFCDPCGGDMVTVDVGDFGGGAVLNAAELVAPPMGLRVRTNMGPAMRAAESLTAANLKFVQLLRDKRLPPQPHAMALRAANIIALSSGIIRGHTSEGEICHVSFCSFCSLF